MTINSQGQFNQQTKDEILNAMIADAREYWGEDLKNSEEAIIRTFYEPIAERFAVSQSDLADVLSASQIDYAEGAGLDLLTALIGIRRKPALNSTGTITLKHKEDETAAPRDYTIPAGTVVQTDSNDPVRYETTESVILKEGSSSVDASIVAQESAINGNTGANTIVVMPSPPVGIREVTNPSATSGGRDEESDESLRNRAKESFGDGSRSSAPALINGVKTLDGVRGVSIFINDSSKDNTSSGGLPDHSFELVVQGGDKQEIADRILEKKAAGDNSYAGVNGTANVVDSKLPNGQSHTIKFSEPNSIKIYVDVDLKITNKYAGDDSIRDSIVNYVGGVLSSGNDISGELDVRQNVLYGKIEYAIRDVRGVYDINSLTIGVTDPPSESTDIVIGDGEISLADATDNSINVSKNEIDLNY
jgi:hypothetical protein